MVASPKVPGDVLVASVVGAIALAVAVGLAVELIRIERAYAANVAQVESELSAARVQAEVWKRRFEEANLAHDDMRDALARCEAAPAKVTKGRPERRVVVPTFERGQQFD